MTRRLHPCRSCKPDMSASKFTLRRGFTRHKDGVCSRCRRYGRPLQRHESKTGHKFWEKS